MLPIKLSHSAVEKYLTCPRMYRYHYIDRLRPNTTGSSLVFGVAVDEALNALLLGEGNPEEIFLEKFSTTQINGKDIDMLNTNQINYFKSDFDQDILSIEDLEYLESVRLLIGLPGTLDEQFDLIFRSGRKPYQLAQDERQFYNLANWVSLKRKGLMMLQAYRSEVLPQIESVVQVQKQLTLENEQGDKLTGVIDLIAKLRTGETVVLDNKTSSKRYTKNSVKESPQLALYASHEETEKAGFIVMVKAIKKQVNKTCQDCGHATIGGKVASCAQMSPKRCGGAFIESISPVVDIQFIVDTVNQELVTEILERYQTVGSAIKDEVFPMDKSKCDFLFGSRCPYYNKCYGDSDEGLDKV